MTIDMGMLAIFVTVLLAIIGLAAAWGALGQRVHNQDIKIEANRSLSEKELERLHTENREDHRQIFTKLEEIQRFMRNGNGKPRTD